MTLLSDAVVIDTAELRAAAAALRAAERGIAELRLRVPGEAWAAPDWLAASAAEGLGLARRALDELGADLRAEAAHLDARADEVDGAERRWWEIANGELRCGCVLPSGTVVAQPGQLTSASSASGPGIEGAAAVIGVGAISAAAGSGITFSTVGGQSLGPGGSGGGGINYVTADGRPIDPASLAAMLGGQASLPQGGGGMTYVTAGSSGPGAVTLVGDSGIAPQYVVSGAAAGMDLMASFRPGAVPVDPRPIASLASGGGVTGGQIGTIISGTDTGTLIGGGMHTYEGPSGRFIAYPSDSRVLLGQHPVEL